MAFKKLTKAKGSIMSLAIIFYCILSTFATSKLWHTCYVIIIVLLLGFLWDGFGWRWIYVFSIWRYLNNEKRGFTGNVSICDFSVSSSAEHWWNSGVPCTKTTSAECVSIHSMARKNANTFRTYLGRLIQNQCVQRFEFYLLL